MNHTCVIPDGSAATVGTVSNDGDRADDRVTLTELSARAHVHPSILTRLIREHRLTVIGTRGRYRVVSAAEAEVVVRLAGVARRTGLQLAVLVDAVRTGAARFGDDGAVMLLSTDDLEDEHAA